MQTLLAIANLDHVPFTPGPVAFRMLVERCLAKNPEQRFAATADIRDKLQRIYEGLPKPVAPKTEEEEELESLDAAIAIPEVVVALPKPQRKVGPVVAGALLAFLTGALAASLWPHAAPINPAKYQFSPLGPSGSFDVFPALSPSGKSVAYSEPVNGVFQIFTRRISNATTIQHTQASEDCFRPFWSPDGTRIYYLAGGDLWAVGDSGGSPQRVLQNVTAADISPDGTTLALARRTAEGSDNLWSLHLGGAPEQFANAPTFKVLDLKYSPNGHEIGISAVDQFWTLRLSRKEFRRALPITMRGFGWLPDGKHLIYGNDHLWIANSSTGKRQEITLGAGHENWPSISKEGGEAIFSTADPHATLVALSLGGDDKRINVPPAGPYSETAPTWNPKRSEFAFVTTRNGRPEIRLRDAQSGWERVVAQDASDVSFSSDGNHLAFTRGGSIWVTSIDGEQPIRIGDGNGAIWSPDGNWLAYTTSSALMKAGVGTASSGQVIRKSPGQPVGWSTDSAWILVHEPSGRLSLITPDGKLTRQAGKQSWLAAAWNGRIIGLRRGERGQLQLASITPEGNDYRVEKDLGAYPPAFAAAAAMGLDPVSGFSVSHDGTTVLASLLAFDSSLWRVDGLR